MKSRAATTKQLPPKPHPVLHRVSEAMRQFAALLEQELLTWPGVSAKPMFGLRGFYRGRRIFAALPRTRAIGAPNAIIFKPSWPPAKLAKMRASDARILTETLGRAGWVTFEIRSGDDLSDAIAYLDAAYRAAKKLGN